MLILTVLFCALLQLSSQTSLVGTHHCTYGPSYWCASVDNAHECGAESHCMRVWKENAVPKEAAAVGAKDTPRCIKCREYVTKVDEMMKAGATQKAIEAALDVACHAVPIAEVAMMCRLIVDRYVPVIMRMLAGELDPQKICHYIGFCAAKGNKYMVRHLPEVTRPMSFKFGNSSTACTECESYVRSVEALVLSQAAVAEIEAALRKYVCGNVPTAERALCEQVVVEAVPQIIDLVRRVPPHTVCRFLGACAAAAVAQRTAAARLAGVTAGVSAGPIECKLCEEVITKARAALRDKKTAAEIEDLLKQEFCSHLGEYKTKCEQYVTTYMPVLIELLVSELEPVVICQAIGACGKQAAILKPRAAFRFAGAPKTPETKKARKTKTTTSVAASVECVLCEFILREIDQMLLENKTEAAITEALAKVCSILPATLAQQCTDFIDSYGPAIFQLLAHYMDPKMVCTTLGLCAAKVETVAGARHNSQPMTVARMAAVECELCHTLVTYLGRLVKRPATEAKIRTALEKVCNYLPTQDRAACNLMVPMFTTEMIKVLVESLDNPDKMCKELGACVAKAKQQERQHAVEAKVVPIKLVHAAVAAEAPLGKKTIKQIGIHILGADACTQGPAYWCAEYAHAKRCGAGALAHCMRAVWARRRGALRQLRAFGRQIVAYDKL